MFKVIHRTMMLLLVSIAVAGCARTTTIGHKMAQPETPIKKLNWVYQSGQFSTDNKLAQKSINDVLNELRALLQVRIPAVFALNGIEVITDNTPPQYELNIVPFRAEYSSYSGVKLDMRAKLIDKAQGSKLIWWGDIHFFDPHSGIGTLEKASDKFAKSVLEQLASDGVIRLEQGEIKMPEEKAK